MSRGRSPDQIIDILREAGYAFDGGDPGLIIA